MPLQDVGEGARRHSPLRVRSERPWLEVEPGLQARACEAGRPEEAA